MFRSFAAASCSREAFFSRFTKVLASRLARIALNSSETRANSASSSACSSMASSIFACAGDCACGASSSPSFFFGGAAAICVVGSFRLLGFGGAGCAFESEGFTSGLLIEPSLSAMLGMFSFFWSPSEDFPPCDPFGKSGPFAICGALGLL